VYTGGLSSFTLFNMVVGYLKHLAANDGLSDLPHAIAVTKKQKPPELLTPAQLLPPPIMTCASPFRHQWEDSLSSSLMWDSTLPPALPDYIRAVTFKTSVVPMSAVADPSTPERWPQWPLDMDVESRSVSDDEMGPAPSFESETKEAELVKHDYGECLRPFVSIAADADRLLADVHEHAQVMRKRLVEEADLGRLLLGILQVCSAPIRRPDGHCMLNDTVLDAVPPASEYGATAPETQLQSGAVVL
jgi:hypothetical protein